MSGYQTYLDFKHTEELANSLGFRFAHSKYGQREHDVIALYPHNDSLPDYARDAELFCGTLSECKRFLQGMQFAKQYYTILNLVSDKKIAAKEQLTRNRHLMATIKTGEKAEGVIGK